MLLWVEELKTVVDDIPDEEEAWVVEDKDEALLDVAVPTEDDACILLEATEEAEALLDAGVVGVAAWELADAIDEAGVAELDTDDTGRLEEATDEDCAAWVDAVLDKTLLVGEAVDEDGVAEVVTDDGTELERTEPWLDDEDWAAAVELAVEILVLEDGTDVTAEVEVCVVILLVLLVTLVWTDELSADDDVFDEDVLLVLTEEPLLLVLAEEEVVVVVFTDEVVVVFRDEVLLVFALVVVVLMLELLVFEVVVVLGAFDVVVVVRVVVVLGAFVVVVVVVVGRTVTVVYATTVVLTGTVVTEVTVVARRHGLPACPPTKQLVVTRVDVESARKSVPPIAFAYRGSQALTNGGCSVQGGHAIDSLCANLTDAQGP